MVKRIYLNRKLHNQSFMNQHSLRNKVIGVLFVFIGLVLVCLVQDNMASSKQTDNKLPLKQNGTQTETIQHLMNLNKNDSITEKKLDEERLSKTESNVSKMFSSYFFQCYSHLKQFEIIIQYHLNKRKEKIDLVSSYSHTKVIKINQSYCSTGKAMLFTFHNIINESPKCIEINGLINPDHIQSDYNTQIHVKLVLIMINRNEVHLYELKNETIAAYALSQISNSQYNIINNTLYYNYSLRFCLNELEQLKFESTLIGDKGIEINWNTQLQTNFCFKNIFFIY